MNAWLVRIAPDLRQRDAYRDFRDIVGIHRRVMTLVPDGLGENPRQQARVLFRLEQSRTGPVILAQTGVAPNIERLPKGYGAVDTRDIGPLLKALERGMRVRYRLAANVSKRVAKGDRAGKIVPLFGAAVEEWWQRKAETHGLRLEQLHVTAEPPAVGHAKPIRHAITRFDGTALVHDPDQVREAVLTGIGRGKAFGCGLLSLAPVR